jgi:hypothetical protein
VLNVNAAAQQHTSSQEHHAKLQLTTHQQPHSTPVPEQLFRKVVQAMPAQPAAGKAAKHKKTEITTTALTACPCH